MSYSVASIFHTNYSILNQVLKTTATNEGGRDTLCEDSFGARIG